MDCSPPGSSVHEIFQTRILEWVASSFSTGSSQSRDRFWVFCVAGRVFANWATRKTPALWIQFSSVAESCSPLWDPVDCSTPGLPVHHQLPELAQTHVHWVSEAIQSSPPLSSPSPPAFNLSQHQVFLNESVLHIRWPKYWSFSFNNSPSNEYSGLISFRIDWFDFLAVQDSHEFSPTPQFKSINSSVLSFIYGPSLTTTHWLLAKP